MQDAQSSLWTKAMGRGTAAKRWWRGSDVAPLPLRQRLRRCHLPIASRQGGAIMGGAVAQIGPKPPKPHPRAVLEFIRSEEHTSELQSLMRISYAVFRLNKKTKKNT